MKQVTSVEFLAVSSVFFFFPPSCLLPQTERTQATAVKVPSPNHWEFPCLLPNKGSCLGPVLLIEYTG